MVRIRPTRAEEAALLPGIERSAGAAFLALPDLAWIADDDVLPEERHRALIAGGAAWVAVGAEDVPLAFLAAEATADRLHIWEFAVRHELQGRGIGRALMAEAKAWAGARGLRAVTLTTFRDVPWNEPFYRRLGFRTLDERELTAELRTVLDAEQRHGLPREKRCAMVCPLEPGQADARPAEAVRRSPPSRAR